MIIYCTAEEQRLRIESIDEMADGGSGLGKVVFSLSEMWNDMTVFAQIRQKDTTGEEYLDEDNSVTIPTWLKPGYCQMTLLGTGTDGSGKVGTTNYVVFHVNANGLLDFYSISDMGESLYQQLVNRVIGVEISSLKKSELNAFEERFDEETDILKQRMDNLLTGYARTEETFAGNATDTEFALTAPADRIAFVWVDGALKTKYDTDTDTGDYEYVDDGHLVKFHGSAPGAGSEIKVVYYRIVGSTAEVQDIHVPAEGFNGGFPYITAGEAVRGQVTALDGKITTVDGKVDAERALRTILSARVDGIGNEVSDARDTYESIGARFDAEETDIGGLRTRMDTAEEDIDTAEANIAALEDSTAHIGYTVDLMAAASGNLCAVKTGRYYINPSTGGIGTSAQNYVWGMAEKIAVAPSQTYTFTYFDYYDEFSDAVSNADNALLHNNPTIYVAWYDSAGDLIDALSHGNITVDRNTKRVRLTLESPAGAVGAATYIFAPDNEIRKEISTGTKIMVVEGSVVPDAYVAPYVSTDETARDRAGDVKQAVLYYDAAEQEPRNLEGLETGGAFRLLSYNVRLYNDGTEFIGDNTQKMREKASHLAQFISSAGADVICTQEDRAYLYYPRTPMKPADIDDDTINVKGINKPAYHTMYAAKYPYYSGAYISGGVDSTDAAIYSGAPAGYDFIPQTVVDDIIVPGRRYAYTDITVGGELVHVYTCNLSASAKDGDNVPYGVEAMRTIRKQQLAAMLAVASNNGDRSRRWVIAGDLNHNSAADKANLIELCETYHAKIANGSSAGWLGTSPASQPIALDNVIVSEGLTVAGFKVLREWENALYSDHAPIVADIMVVHGCGRDGGSGQFTSNFYGTATSQARRLNGTTLGTAGKLKCLPGEVYNIQGTITGELDEGAEGATLNDVVFTVYFFGVENGENKRIAVNRTGNNMGYAIAPDWATTMEVCCTVLFEAGKTSGPQSCTVTYDYLLTRVDNKQRTGAVRLHIGTFNTGMFNAGHNDGAPFGRGNLDEKYIEMSRFVAENDFGILCLQELSMTALTTTGAKLLEILNHYYPYGLNKTETIFTQYPVLGSDRGSFTAKYDGNTRNWSLAELLCDGLRVVVMCLHLAYQTDAGSVREAQATEAIGILGDYTAADAVIVCGDFNDFDHSVFPLFAQNGYVPLNGRDGVYATTTGHNTEYRAMNAELQRLAAGGTIPAADMDNATNIVARLNTALGVNYSIVDGVPHDYSPEIANSSEVSIDNILIKADHFTGGVAKCPFLRDEDAPDEWRSYLSDHIALSANITIE